MKQDLSGLFLPFYLPTNQNILFLVNKKAEALANQFSAIGQLLSPSLCSFNFAPTLFPQKRLNEKSEVS